MLLTSRSLSRLGHWAAGLLTGLVAMAAHSAPLVMAIGDSTLFAPLQLAAQEGFFAAEGLEVQVIGCINGRRCLKHLTDGEAQVATVADTPMVFALHAGHRFDIIATFGSSSRDTALVARTDRGIAKPADLAGKRIGVVRGTSAHYFTNVFLLVNGVPRDSVNLVFIDPIRGAEPLLRGEVDAAGLYRPTGPQALEQLGAKGVQLPTLRPYTVMVNLVAQPGLSQDTLLRLLKAAQRGVALLNGQPGRAHELLGARWKLDARHAAAQLDGYEFRLSLDQTLLSTLEAESRWAVREGLVESRAVPDYLELMRVEPLRALDPRAMTIVK
ncbi:NitT/TauT family transport system substrate-binding protein [Pelomonas saccharophila]|uniref:NitT/TauT family transport system substrate-binding protein n=1 Tax=Roseateles saccharophilus TaxID=304 RepID=A0ABU1YK40_ROSSA|nr:ABC transporter substrate-binding protein [Roseateles saccharophilus]MDR7269230.1 NitT/TauT family transport system substrate-binding protein [Roseateles saccharophilus]